MRVVLLIALVVGLACAADYHGDDWQKQSAVQKKNALWAEVTGDTTPGSFPNALEAGVLFVESMDTSFDSAADDMPYNDYLDLIRRKKLIHSVGTIAQAKWVSTGNHPYTGVFKGADNLFIRFSSAQPVAPNDNMTPGISLKFIRDGVKSANLMAMYSLSGQKSMNFFAHDLTNHVPNLGGDISLPQKALLRAFKKASKWPTMLALSDMASYDQKGNKVAQPQFPFRLVFSPNPSVTAMFPETGNGDFPTDTQQLKAGTAVYDVLAEDKPDENNLHYEKSKPVKIGQIILTGVATSTNFGDKLLFFQHQRMDDDLAVHPDWVEHVDAILDAQANTEGGFYFPDVNSK